MTKLVNRTVILAKTEITYGIDAAPTPALNAILVQKATYKPAGLRMVKRPALKMTLGALQPLYAGMLFDCELEVEMKGNSTSGTIPEIDPLLLACGMASTIVTSPPMVTYQPASTNQSSCTIYIYEDGSVYKLTGCRGELKISAKTGGIAVATFTMTGHLTFPADVAVTTPSYSNALPVPLVNMNFLVGEYAPIIDTLEVQLGNQIEQPPDISAADGFGEVIIGARAVTGSLDPQADLMAVMNWWNSLSAGTAAVLSILTAGQPSGKKFEIKCPIAAITNNTPGERNGIVTYALTFDAMENAGDDEISIIFD